MATSVIPIGGVPRPFTLADARGAPEMQTLIPSRHSRPLPVAEVVEECHQPLTSGDARHLARSGDGIREIGGASRTVVRAMLLTSVTPVFDVVLIVAAYATIVRIIADLDFTPAMSVIPLRRLSAR